MDDTEVKTYDRLPGEGARPYAAFRAYLQLGPLARTYGKTGETIQRSKQLIGKWASRWHWQERARDWDKDQALQEDAAWVERANQVRTRGWALHERLFERCMRMLSFPLTATRMDDESGVTIVTPVRWDMNTAVHVARLAVELGRLSAGLPTQDQKVTLTDDLSDSERARAISTILEQFTKETPRQPDTGADEPME